MSRLLAITPVPPIPADAGNRARIKTMFDALELAGHSLTVIHLLREEGDIDAMQERWSESYIPVFYCEPKANFTKRIRRWRQRLRLASGYTYGLDDWYDASVDRVIEKTVRERKIEAVIANYIFFSKALQAVPSDVVKILDTHDRFGDRHKRFLEAGVKPSWYSCTPSDEKRGLERAHLILAIQEQEAEYFRSIVDIPVATVGHLVDVSPGLITNPSGETSYPTNHRILIVGSANSINVESTRWYIENVFPEVRRQVPNVKLDIAGSVCDELEAEDGVELHGRVESLATHYSLAQLVVNPMLLGTGLKIKSIEALGYRRALLSSSAGCEGLEDAKDRAFIQADGREQFVQKTVHLLNAPKRCAELGQQGGDFAERYNSSSMRNFNDALDRLLQNKQTN